LPHVEAQSVRLDDQFGPDPANDLAQLPPVVRAVVDDMPGDLPKRAVGGDAGVVAIVDSLVEIAAFR